MIENIQIGETRRVGGRLPSEDALEITIHEDLYRAFITDVWVESSRRILNRVCSFGFLYSLIRQVYLFESSPSVEIEIGDILWLVGRKLEGCGVLESSGVALELLQHRDFCISRYGDMTNTQFLMSVSMLISSLVQSLKNADVDVDGFVRRFPPPLF